MSHFSELKTNLTDVNFLKKALQKMGFTIVEGEGQVEVRGYFGATMQAEFKITTKTHYDIGFVRDAQGNYEIVGDWEVLPKASGIDQEVFAKALKKEYARTTIEEIAQQQGYAVECVESEETGEIQMVVTQW